MSRIKRKNTEVTAPIKSKIKTPFGKTIWFKIFSIFVIVSVFLVPILSLLMNFVSPRQQPVRTTTQNIQVKN
jgi:hypothetical protein